MKKVNRVKRLICTFILNHFLCGTRFYSIKRKLLNISGIKVGDRTKIVGPIYIGNVSEICIGENTFIGREFKVYGNGHIEIGNNVDLAPDVAFLTGSHSIDNGIRRAGRGVSYNIHIGDGCWIGARTTILGDIQVGEKAVIGAGSLVNKTVQANVVAVGCPAHIVKKLL